MIRYFSYPAWNGLPENISNLGLIMSSHVRLLLRSCTHSVVNGNVLFDKRETTLWIRRTCRCLHASVTGRVTSVSCPTHPIHRFKLIGPTLSPPIQTLATILQQFDVDMHRPISFGVLSGAIFDNSNHRPASRHTLEACSLANAPQANNLTDNSSNACLSGTSGQADEDVPSNGFSVS